MPDNGSDGAGPRSGTGGAGGLDDEQAFSDLDQTLSDADQTASDADQTASDADEAASHADQEHADLEQRASEHDQSAADRDAAASPGDAESRRAYDASRAERIDASAIREAAAASRAVTTLERTQQAIQRDEVARRRDLTALSRDRAAAARDRAVSRQAQALLATALPGDTTLRMVLAASGGVREHAAADRARAASDRRRAAADRAHAADDRRQARVELQRVQVDSLTGVYMRDLGLLTLQHSIDRARRSDEPFVLAFVDVDGLKRLNDREGHAAGDALLQDVVIALKARLRSYDPIARVGGDEFICGLTNSEMTSAKLRFDEIRALVEAGPSGGSITVGFARLGVGDTLETLTARADADMYAHKPLRPDDAPEPAGAA